MSVGEPDPLPGDLRPGIAQAPEPAGAPVPGSRPGRRRGLSPVREAVAAIGRGEMVLVVDDDEREDEGDLVMAAEHVTPAAVNFMATHGRGLVCVPMTAQRLSELDLPPMVADNGDPHGTAFTVSVDLADPGSTGISAADRAATIRALLDPHTGPDDLRQPGHVFPLRARDGGVLERPGHTEAAVDLAGMAGARPAGVICEVMRDDGTMARLPDLLAMADRFDLHLVTVADLIDHRRRTESQVERRAGAQLPTEHGALRAVAYRSPLEGVEHLAVLVGDPEDAGDVLTRVHSECLTGDVLGSRRCDCGAQLDTALDRLVAEGTGVLVYVRGHEGRGIGLGGKLAAYALQDGGADTVEANVELGYPPDDREYGAAAQILRDLGIPSVRLLTNNPAKPAALEDLGVGVTERVPLQTAPTPANRDYLAAKRDKLGHLLELEPAGGPEAPST